MVISQVRNSKSSIARDLSFDKERIVFRALFKIHHRANATQSLAKISDNKTTFVILIQKNQPTASKLHF